MPTSSAEKLNRQYRLRHTAVTVLSFLLALAMLLPLAWYVRCYTLSATVFREAKNARLALRYLTIEYAAEDRAVADAAQADGFSVGTAAQLAELADAPGHLQLVSWDSAAHTPRILSYTRNDVVVVYTYDTAADTEHWQVSYAVPLMDFSR